MTFKKPTVRRGCDLRTITQTAPKSLGAVSITLWCLLRGVLPPHRAASVARAPQNQKLSASRG